MPAARLLLGLLVRDATVFEFGSGGSTLWLADRVKRLLSIEDNTRWFSAVLAELQARQPLPNVEIQLVQTNDLAAAIDGTGEWDVVFVDCYHRQRRKAILRARAHVKPGGWLVADDYHFPIVTKTINRLEQDGWDVSVMTGVKIHKARNVPVRTATAFCRKLD